MEQIKLENVIENENPIDEIDELQIETIESYEDIEEEIEQDTEVEIINNIEDDSGKKSLSVDTEIQWSETKNFEKENNTNEIYGTDIVYVKISSKALKKKIFGFMEKVDVNYKFNCDKKIDVFLVSGEAKNTKEDDYIKEYKKTIIANKEKKQTEDIVIFGIKVYNNTSWFSSREATLKINVEYGENVKSEYDKNTPLYFK